MNKNKQDCLEWLMLGAIKKMGISAYDENTVNLLVMSSILIIDEAERRILSGDAK